MKNKIRKRMVVKLSFYLGISAILFSQIVPASAQVEGTAKKYVRIGYLQSHFSAYGSERAWNNVYYEGLIWPADYPYQDNAVIKRFWIAADSFIDTLGNNWAKYGLYFAADYVDESLFPMELKQTAKFEPPTVYVDGNNITAPYAGDVDEINPDQIPDRIITNVVNTSMGLTMTRRVLVFSQQYHDNYFIKEFTFTNTGNVDYDDDIELNAPLKGVRISWGTRYSVCREGSWKMGNDQSWGKHSCVTKRGETYPEHAGDIITEDTPLSELDWLRCGFQWAGQNASNAFDNIGAPDKGADGRLCAPQHVGVAVLHVDKSATDNTDDSNQPVVLGWHAGDTYPSLGDMTDVEQMIKLYDMVSGNPYGGESNGGNDRFDETYGVSNCFGNCIDPWTVHNDGGGTNLWVCYGPWDLEPGESITIVEAEGISGLSREACIEIGKRWLKAYNDPTDKGPFTLPDGSTTDDKNEYKNVWVYTGKDSIIKTFSRAKRNFDINYNIPQPPLPPPLFEVTSGGDRISLSWNPSPSEVESDFAGYKIYRAIGKTDTFYVLIDSCGPGVTSFDDVKATRGQSYYYYIVAYNNGNNNATGDANPTGLLHSSRFYTKTTEPAYLRRQAGTSLDAIRVVPNPYNISARGLQYIGEPDKLMFLDIPGHCTIRIYTERGDLIETIEHEDGSGDEPWASITSYRQVVVSGVYIAHFQVTEDQKDPVTGEILYRKGEQAIRKFLIIR
jgi:hypothetical protein